MSKSGNSYIYEYSTRSGQGVAVLALSAIFIAVAGGFFAFAPESRPLSGILLLFFSFVFVYSIYRFFRAAVWRSEIMDGVLRWRSPYWPREDGEVRISEIVVAQNTGMEIDAVKLTLENGRDIFIPNACTGDPRPLLEALLDENHKISVLFNGRRITGFAAN